MKHQSSGEKLSSAQEETERVWERFESAYTAVFLVNDLAHPTHIGMMKRGPNQKRFPNQYTGTGGALEDQDVNQVEGAKREWEEEIGLAGVEPKEFGRIIINGKGIIFYFVALYPMGELPAPKPSDGKFVGEVEWIPIEEVMGKDIVPTTRYFMDEWKKRSWTSQRPFTVFLEREDVLDVKSAMKSLEIVDGLQGEK
jgi:8-oxo-dGTP pyrophosphatase MutT (NUDIX family)